MSVVTSLIVGYLLLSLFATIILICACVVGGRFDRFSARSDEPMLQESLVEVQPETLPEAEVKEAKVLTGEINRLMPQLLGQATD